MLKCKTDKISTKSVKEIRSVGKQGELSTKNGIVTRKAEKFQDEESYILSLIPSDVKNSFRKLGFVKWNRIYLPVIELSPYDVAPGFVREHWMRMFHLVRTMALISVPSLFSMLNICLHLKFTRV